MGKLDLTSATRMKRPRNGWTLSRTIHLSQNSYNTRRFFDRFKSKLRLKVDQIGNGVLLSRIDAVPRLCMRNSTLDVRLVRPMRPSQIGSREDRARRPCRSPAVLQGLTGIVIPSRKNQARHSGQLCSIRGKSGGARSEARPYRRFQQTGGQSTARLELRVALGFALFFS
jgi:hypothetical protein